MTARWLAESMDGTTLAARVGRDGDRLVAEWPRRARLSVRRDGGDVVFEPHPEADAAEVEKLRRGAVGLLLAHLRGAIPLHASAVALEGRAIVFVGAAGLGKSTLAATLCDLSGGSLLGDDAVAIERDGESYEVVALEDRHWLDAAAARALGRTGDFGSTKVAVVPRRLDIPRSPLGLIVHLAFSDEASEARLVPLEGLGAVAGLLSQLTRFVVDEPEVARRDLGSLADLVARTRVARLERPRQLDLLATTAHILATALNGERQ